MINYPVRLSTTEPNNPVGVLKIRQDDKGTQKIVARITTNSQLQDLTGLEVAFNMRTAEGNVVIEKAVVKDAKIGTIEYVVSGYATQQAGRNTAYFTFFIGEDEQFSTKDFSYFVTNSVTSEGIRGCDYIWRFEDLLEFVTDLANQSQIQLNKLTSDVEVIQKQIDDMFALIASQGVLTADEVRKIMINFISGEDIEVTVKSDFTGKIAGSIIENANIFKRNSSIGLQIPSHNTWGENAQSHYDAIKKLDETVATFSYSSEGAVAAGGIPWNAIWVLEKSFPLIFKNVTTIAEKVIIAKNKITYLDINAHGKGSGPNGNKFYLNAFNTSSGAWATPVNHTSNAISKLTYSYHKPDILLSNEGFINVAMYTDSSNGTTASSVSIDYANIEIKVKFNISEFVATKAQHEALKSSYTALKLVVDDHVADTVKHITATERTKWNGKQDVSTLSKNEVLWTGGLMMASSHSITPSKALSQCENGWMLKWNKYVSGTGTTATHACLTFIPKSSGLLGTVALPIAIMQEYDFPVVTKCLVFSNTVLTGHGANDLKPNNYAVLTEIRSI